jgi:hypothetical protein
MTYRERREAQAYFPEAIAWRIVASEQRVPQGIFQESTCLAGGTYEAHVDNHWRG